MTTFTPSAPPRRRFSWKGLAWLFLFFWYFSGVTQTLIQITGTTGFQGFREAFLLSAIWLIPVLLFPTRTRLIAGILGIILFACSLLSFGYFLIYQQEFSQSVIFVIFESNDAEAGEYLSQYFAWWMVPAFLFYTLGAVLLWTRVQPVYVSSAKAMILSIMLLIGLVGLPLYKQTQRNDNFGDSLQKFEDRIESVVPWQLLIGYRNYREQLNGMQAMLAENAKVAPLENLKDYTAKMPATLVLVIGESTNRSHMSLYGYARKTTPNLDRMRDQLDVFNNVISPRPYTIESLQQVLTFADEQHPDLFLSSPSIVDVMKQAGYKTWWITNQQTLTKRNTMLTTFSQQTDEQIYLNNNRNQNAAQHDGDVLEPFAKVLADGATRKLIVIHLLGTHVNYDYRYPQEYAKFTGREGAPSSLSEQQLATYNSYDNAVLYNDFVVSSIIKQFAESDPNGFLLYLSDHGEDVYDSGTHDNLGRSEGRPTAPMYTIPFLTWASPKWRATHDWNFGGYLSRPYSSASLIHTWADMAGLTFTEHTAAFSLVSPDFVPRTRWIGNPYQPKTLSDFDQLENK